MRRFFTLLSLLCVVAISLVVSDLYKVESKLTGAGLSAEIEVKKNPNYTGVVGIEAFQLANQVELN